MGNNELINRTIAPVIELLREPIRQEVLSKDDPLFDEIKDCVIHYLAILHQANNIAFNENICSIYVDNAFNEGLDFSKLTK